MRFFPSAARQRRIVVACAAGTMALGVAIPLAHADDDLKHQRKQVEHQIAQAHDDLDATSEWVARTNRRLERAVARLDAAEAHLAGVRVQLTAAREHDRELQAELAASELRLAQAEAALAAGQAAVVIERRRLADTVTGIYEQGDPGLLALSSFLNAESAADLTRRQEAERTIVDTQAQVYDDVHEAEVQLRAREAEVEQATQELADRRREAAAHVVRLRSLRDRAVSARERVQLLVVRSRDARREAWRARAHDRVVLAQLRRREQQIKRQILAAARRAAAQRPKAGFHGDSDGLLDDPVAGPVTSPYGYRTHPIYGYYALHNGTDFGAGCGARLYAGASGTVMSTYYDAVYGNRLYLNVGQVNGKNLTLVYNHLSGYAVGQGAHVSRGQTVGYVGDTGWSTGCHLHFTVLVNGSPVDPMGYL